ncbi:MAG: hypothetical protein HOV80_37145 [Polyangiaceae bacterium]|nr:hypothetical protein [Polyangiaceae bacterium]
MTEEPESLPALPKRRSGLPILIAFLLLVGGGAFALYWFSTRPDTFKVLVAIDADGPWYKDGDTSEAISEEIAGGLDKIGFEVVKTDDKEAIAVLKKSKTLEDAAFDLRAGFVISGTVDPEVIEHPVEGGFVEVRAKVTLEVTLIGSDTPPEKDTFTAWAGGPTKKDAMKILGDSIASRAFDASVPRITGHPLVKEKLERGDMTALVRLDAAKRFLETRAAQLEAAKLGYDTVKETRTAHKGPRPITYYGDFRGLDFLAGTGPAGALINTQGKRAFYHPKRSELLYINDLETVAWRTEGADDKVLWSGYHVLGYPAAAPDGSAVLFVEDLFGRAKTLTVVDSSGTPRRVMTHEQARFDNPEIAPGGGAAAMYVRLCYGCGRDFAVFALTDGTTLFRRDHAGEADEGYGGYAWIEPKKAVYVVRPAVTEVGSVGGDELRVVDITSRPATDTKLASLEGERCGGPSTSADGKKILLACSGMTYRAVVFDAASGERTETTIIGISPVISPDGTKAAYTRDGDVFVANLADGAETRLTQNEFYERHPLWSTDNKRVYFESQAEDPMFKGKSVGVVASVEAP